MDSQWRTQQLKRLKRPALLSSLLVGALLVVSFQNCSKSSPASAESPVTATSAEVLAANAMAVLKNNCYSCHNPESPNGNFIDVTSLDELLYKRLVVPGEPQLSIMFLDVQAGSMPPSGPIPADQVQMLSDWIISLRTSGTGSGSGPPMVLGPNFTAINNFIIKPKCLGCHNSTNAAKGISFSSYQQVMMQITPGLPASSLFYTEIVGGTMPPVGPLTPAEVSAVNEWILTGALNN